LYGDTLAKIACGNAHNSSSVAPRGGCRLCAGARVFNGMNRVIVVLRERGGNNW